MYDGEEYCAQSLEALVCAMYIMMWWNIIDKDRM